MFTALIHRDVDFCAAGDVMTGTGWGGDTVRVWWTDLQIKTAECLLMKNNELNLIDLIHHSRVIFERIH